MPTYAAQKQLQHTEKARGGNISNIGLDSSEKGKAWLGGIIIALVPPKCEQMIYNICHETKLNFAFTLTPFMVSSPTPSAVVSA